MFKNIARKAGYDSKKIHIHNARYFIPHNLIEVCNKLE